MARGAYEKILRPCAPPDMQRSGRTAGTAMAGRVVVDASALDFEGAGRGRHASRHIPYTTIASARLGRGPGDRVGGRPALVVELDRRRGDSHRDAGDRCALRARGGGRARGSNASRQGESRSGITRSCTTEPSSADSSKTRSAPSCGASTENGTLKSNVPRVPEPDVAVTKFLREHLAGCVLELVVERRLEGVRGAGGVQRARHRRRPATAARRGSAARTPRRPRASCRSRSAPSGTTSACRRPARARRRRASRR